MVRSTTDRERFLKSRKRTDIIVKQVKEWASKNECLSSVDLTLAYITAIQAIRKRTLVTLSNVTVNAVVDRTLFECKEKYAALGDITNDSKGLNFQKFEEQVHDTALSDRNLALHELLIELLEVFGKITASILTKYLIQELNNITPESIQKLQDSRGVRQLGSAMNRDKK